MRELAAALQKEAVRLLSEGVELFIGYTAGTRAGVARPYFITKPEETSGLTFDPFCTHNLVKYLLRYPEKKVAVVVKGCDQEAVDRLIAERHLDRARITLVGVPCGGMLDRDRVLAGLGAPAAIEEVEDRGSAFVLRVRGKDHIFEKKEFLLEKCRSCSRNNPASVDLMVGKEAPPVADPEYDPYAKIKEIEALPASERSRFWDRFFSRCLRCYACREVCPACSCTECAFEQAVPGWQQGATWISKARNLADNYHYHLIRAFHVAGRCAGCAECERVCPVGIPLMLLNRKLAKEIAALFGPAPADPCGVLCTYSVNDPDEFE